MTHSLIERLGIQSWCFRKLKTAQEIIAALKECDVNRLEICGVHFDVKGNNDEILKAYHDAGIVLSSCGVQNFGCNEADWRAAFEFAVAAGIPVISAHVEIEALDLLENLCVEYGKKLAHHNHGRKHKMGSLAAIDDLLRRSSENIGLCIDTAWLLDSGENPVEVARKHGSRLYGMHLKDFVFDRAGKPEDVIVGTGNLDLPGMVKVLKEVQFRGYLTIEYEADENQPVPALKRCVEVVKQALKQH